MRILRKLILKASYTYYVVMTRLLGMSYLINKLRGNVDPRLTVSLLRKYGAHIGKGTTIKRTVMLDNVYEDENSTGDFSHLIIGNNCYIGDGVYFDLANIVALEDDIVIAAKVTFVTHSDCNRSEYLARRFPRRCEKITVGRGSWIGVSATILAGVMVGENSVIAAKSLVNDDVESKTVFGGVPAKQIKVIPIDN